MAAYVIAEIDIADAARYAEYVAAGRPLLARHGARVLAAGGALEAFEGRPQGARIVIIEFPSLEAARGWYRSAEYGPVKAIRRACATSILFAVEGLAEEWPEAFR